MKLMRGIFFFAFFVALSPTPILSQWTQVNGSFGTQVKCMVEYNEAIYIGTTSGIFSSNDNGNNWTPRNNGFGQSIVEKPIVTSMVVSFNGPLNIYATTNFGVSKFDGFSWSLISSLTTSTPNYLPANLTCITINAAQTLYVGSSSGIYKSSNFGSTWELISNANVLSIKAIGNAVYAGTRTGIILYNGQNWSSVYNGLPIYCIESSTGIFAGSDGKLFVSTNGTTWTNFLPPTQPNNPIRSIYASQSGSEVILGIYDNALLRSINGGGAWSSIPLTIFSSRVQSVLKKSDYVFIGTNNSGMFRYSTTNNTLTQINVGLNNIGVSSLVAKDSKIFAGFGGNGIYTSDVDDNLWAKNINGYNSASCSDFVLSGAGIYAAGEDVFSTINGLNWVPCMTGRSISWLTASGNVLLAGSMVNGVWRSNDSGISWGQINAGLSSTYITALGNNGTTFFVGTNTGLYKMSMDDNSWTLVKSSFYDGIYGGYINAIAATGNSIFVGTLGYGIFRSQDLGVTWQQFNNTTANATIGQVSCFMLHGGNIFTGTTKGVIYSTNTGNTWIPLIDGLNEQINNMTINGDKLYAGTGHLGIWKRDISNIISDVIISKSLPLQRQLNQNYPNPFNPETTISYQIPTAGFITLKVYDVLGNEVAALVNEYKQAGTYNISFNTRHLERSREMPSGIYFYRLTSGNYSEVKKMMLIK